MASLTPKLIVRDSLDSPMAGLGRFAGGVGLSIPRRCWFTFDARHNHPRIGRIVMARGRDAADVAISTAFGPARLTRHQGYGMSQSRRAMVECIFRWGKQHGTMRKTKHRGIARVAADFLLNLIAYNLIRIPNCLPLNHPASPNTRLEITSNSTAPP